MMCVIVVIWNCLYFMGKKIKIKIEVKIIGFFFWLIIFFDGRRLYIFYKILGVLIGIVICLSVYIVVFLLNKLYI